MVRIVSTEYLPEEARTPDLYGGYNDHYGELSPAPAERTEKKTVKQDDEVKASSRRGSRLL